MSGVVALVAVAVLLIALLVAAKVRGIRLMPRSSTDRRAGGDSAQRGVDLHRASDSNTPGGWPPM